MEKERSAGAVIFKRVEKEIYYLLLHYASGHWDFPKGHIEKREDELETVKREVEEEAGLKDIEFVDGFKETIRYFFRKSYKEKKKPPLPSHQKIGGGGLIFKEVVFYLAETEQKEIKISREHIGYKWLPYKEALERLTFHNAKDILRKAHKHLTQPPHHNEP